MRDDAFIAQNPCPNKRLRQNAPSLNELGANPREFVVGDRAGLLELIEFCDFVGDTESNRAPQLLAPRACCALRSAMPRPCVIR